MKNMNKKPAKINLFRLLVILTALMGVFFYFRFKTYEVKAPSTLQKQISMDTETNINQPAAAVSQIQINNQKADMDISTLSISIFMYHHIRSYNNSNDSIGTNLSVAPDKFAAQLDLMQQNGYQTTTFEDLLNGNIPAKPIILTFDDGYKNFYQYAYPELKKRSMKAVSFIITSYIGSDDYMNENEINEIAANGIEIGSHTISHPDLSTLTPDKAQKEIFDSKSTLEKKFGLKVIPFCYPSGKYNNEAINLVREAGYDFAVTTRGGYANFSNPFDLQRERVNSDTNISVYLKQG